jgi:hypothetical protein
MWISEKPDKAKCTQVHRICSSLVQVQELNRNACGYATYLSRSATGDFLSKACQISSQSGASGSAGKPCL